MLWTCDDDAISWVSDIDEFSSFEQRNASDFQQEK